MNQPAKVRKKMQICNRKKCKYTIGSTRLTTQPHQNYVLSLKTTDTIPRTPFHGHGRYGFPENHRRSRVSRPHPRSGCHKPHDYATIVETTRLASLNYG